MVTGEEVEGPGGPTVMVQAGASKVAGVASSGGEGGPGLGAPEAMDLSRASVRGPMRVIWGARRGLGAMEGLPLPLVRRG